MSPLITARAHTESGTPPRLNLRQVRLWGSTIASGVEQNVAFMLWCATDHDAARTQASKRASSRASSFGSQNSGIGDVADTVVPLEAPFDMANPLTAKPPQQSVATSFSPASLARVASARMQALPRALADASSAPVAGSNPIYTPPENGSSSPIVPFDPVPFVGANPMYSPSDEARRRAVARPSLQHSPAPPGLKRGTSVRSGNLGTVQGGDGDDKRRGMAQSLSARRDSRGIAMPRTGSHASLGDDFKPWRQSPLLRSQAAPPRSVSLAETGDPFSAEFKPWRQSPLCSTSRVSAPTRTDSESGSAETFTLGPTAADS